MAGSYRPLRSLCMFCVSAVSLIVGAVLLSSQIAAADSDSDRHFANGVVAADHPAASAAGISILRRGGNVVDAAVATSFALSVVRPGSCGVGGGGLMLIHNAESEETVALDYRETAPAAAARDMFQNSVAGESLSVRGGQAVAVPGTVAGLCFAAEHYGTLPLATILAPAIELAERGVVPDAHARKTQTQVLRTFERYPDYSSQYSRLKQLYLNDGVLWQQQQVFHSPQLALLRVLAEQGAAAFYRGPVARAIVDTVRQYGGQLTMTDLANWQPVVRQPLQRPFRNATVVCMPPPSSGGIALLQTLRTLEHWEREHTTPLEQLQHNSSAYVHVVVEAVKHAFADRAEFLGDTDFVSVPVSRLLSDRYTRQIARRIVSGRVGSTKEYGRFFSADDSGTSHFCVMDSHGNAVACTETINLAFGSFVVVPEYGIVLNNEMDDFAAEPGRPNAFGLLQSVHNAIEPGKRPLSSMTPTLVLREGRAVFAAGASGGPRIISATLQATLNHVVFDMSPQQAVTAPRFHHQWFPDELRLEPELLVHQAALQQWGHQIRTTAGVGASQSSAAGPVSLRGGSDPRKHGKPAGF